MGFSEMKVMAEKKGLTLVNVAQMLYGATCSASSAYNDHPCRNAIDGSDKEWAVAIEGTLGWIRVNFYSTYHIVGAWLTSRKHPNDRVKRVDFLFSNGSHYTVPAANTKWPQYYDFTAVTDFVQVQIQESYPPYGWVGFKDIKFMALFKDVNTQGQGKCAFPFWNQSKLHYECTPNGGGPEPRCYTNPPPTDMTPKEGICSYSLSERRFCHLVRDAPPDYKSDCSIPNLSTEWAKGQGCCSEDSTNWYNDRMPQNMCRALNREEKEACHIGTNAGLTACETAGCCHTSLHKDTDKPACFKAKLPPRYCKYINVTKAESCGSTNNETECKNIGCCFVGGACYRNELQCLPYHFWPYCDECYCGDGSCNMTGGVCPGSNCKSGWKDITQLCRTPCEQNHYGVNCAQKCNCTNPDGCDRFKGPRDNCTCIDTHFNPPTCDQIKKEPRILMFRTWKVNPGQAANFSCAANGHPIPQSEDFKLEVPCNSVKNVTQHDSQYINGTNGTGLWQVEFTVEPVQAEEIYNCTVHTISGEFAKTLMASTAVLPILNQTIVVQTLNATYINLTWGAWSTSDIGEGPIELYTIFYKNESVTDWTECGDVRHSRCSPSSGCSLQRTNLKPFGKYWYNIKTSRIGVGGQGDFGKATYVELPCYYPSKAPEITKLKSTCSGKKDGELVCTVRITIKIPHRATWNCGQISMYEVFLEHLESNKTLNLTYTDWSRLKNITLKQCVSGNYKVQVAIVNNKHFASSRSSPNITIFKPEVDDGGNGGLSAGAIVGITIGVLAIVILPLLLFLLYRMRKTKEEPTRGRVALNAEIIMENRAEENAAHTDENEPLYCNVSSHGASSVVLDELGKYIRKKKDDNAFHDEYQGIPDCPPGPEYKTTVADKPENKEKNRFRGIVPYDKNRVTLLPLPGNPNSDYVNASFIDGYKQTNMFIAAQGPNKASVDDFVRMIWQEKIRSIVMLTNVTEGARKKCEQYWPEEGTATFAGIKMTVEKKEAQGDSVITTLKLMQEGEELETTHYHYVSWPDHGAPQGGAALISFLHKITSEHEERKGPILVHCSAGIGRTGTLISLDYLLQQGKETGRVDILECVRTLRKQRINMVQALEQYVFIHDTLYEVHKCGDVIIPCNVFQNTEEKFSSSDLNQRKIQNQYELIQTMTQVPENKDYSAAKSKENSSKNRDPNVLSPNWCRVHLMTTVEGRTDYINALFVDSYRKKDAFIVTQTPSEDTVVDFWRMVHDYKSRTIVMLDDLPLKKDETIYWPNDVQEYEPLHVELTKTTNFHGVVEREMTLYHKKRVEKKCNIKQFQLKGWSREAEVPESSDGLLSLIEKVQLWQKECGSSPVTIHCRNGALHSGLFCAGVNICQKIHDDQEVDVYQVVKFLRTNRIQFISSQGQYTYCYDLAGDYLAQFQNYANFR